MNAPKPTTRQCGPAKVWPTRRIHRLPVSAGEPAPGPACHFCQRAHSPARRDEALVQHMTGDSATIASHAGGHARAARPASADPAGRCEAIGAPAASDPIVRCRPGPTPEGECGKRFDASAPALITRCAAFQKACGQIDVDSPRQSGRSDRNPTCAQQQWQLSNRDRRPSVLRGPG